MVMRDAVAEGLRRLLIPLACRAPVRVFALEGVNSSTNLDDLRLRDDICLVDSPRSANVLWVAGLLPDPLHDFARRVHDMMSHPRATVWSRPSVVPAENATLFPHATIVGPSEDLFEALRTVQRELLTKRHASDEALLPDEEPAPWRGVGPYGQGGTGMTGGVPYGRPMAERAPDRDGLELDQLPMRIGPFFPPFPSGLILDVRLQGDVVQEVTIAESPFAQGNVLSPGESQGDLLRDPFRRALREPVPVGELELARARHHLRWLAHALRVHGLEALGRRVLMFVPTLEPSKAGDILALRRLLNRTRTLDWSTAGVGIIERQQLSGRGLGPVARAAGLSDDSRLVDPAYKNLSFEPLVHNDGDCRARWRQRLGEVSQSLALAARAGAQPAGGAGSVESPRGVLRPETGPTPALLTLLPGLVRGMEWGDAVTTIVSLDLDVREARAASPVEQPTSGKPAVERDE